MVARLESWVNDLATFTFDISQFHECSTTVDGLQLIKGQFGVGHWFEVVVELMPPTPTPSPNTASESMTCLMLGCDLAHTPPSAGLFLPWSLGISGFRVS